MELSASRAQKRAATAARILDAARAEFGDRGMERATIRGIARRAGVDPSLVLQHYGSKTALFASAVTPVAELDDDHDVESHLAEVLDVRLRDLPPATRALLRSMLTSPDAARAMSAHLRDRAAALASDDDDSRRRAAVLVASVLGVTIARHFLDLPALHDLDGDDAARILGAILPEGGD